MSIFFDSIFGGWAICNRSEFDEAKLQKKISEAEGQLARYANDPRIQAVAARVPLKKLVLVYNGWELVYRAEWQPKPQP